MKTRVCVGSAGLAAAVIVLGQVGAFTGHDIERAPGLGDREVVLEQTGAIGPDVIVGDLPQVWHWTTSGGESAYSVATTSCNIGDMDLDWIDAPSNLHPAIGQNMYKITNDGRFEQIGMSWLKHGFCALQLPLSGCGSCGGGGGCLDHLTPGCSDPYSAQRNGGQGGLGPRWQVNPVTGVFPVPWDEGDGTSGSFNRRLRVNNSDLDPVLNNEAKYFVEGHYVTQDDSAWGNQNNNSSYRQVAVDPDNFDVQVLGQTQQTKPAIQAWQDFVEGVQLEEIQIPGDGLFIIGSRAWERQPGVYNYEYAIYNMNSDRAAGSFEVPLPEGVNPNGIGFRDVDHHSGSAWEGTDWESSNMGTHVEWKTNPFEVNANSNAIRWATVYNFRFIAAAPPGPVQAELGLFKPGTPESVLVNVIGPQPVIVECPLDLDSSGAVDFQDLLAVLSVWGPCGGCPEDFDEDGFVAFPDLLALLSNWGPCE